MNQIEITKPVSVLDDAGKPVNFGWARYPYFNYDPAYIRSNNTTISESDRYFIISPMHILSFEILDNGFLGYAGISVVSLKEKKWNTQVFTSPFTLGALGLSPNSSKGSVRFQKQKAILDFVAMEGGARIIKADIPKFGHRRMLRGEVVLSPPTNAESIVTHMPWRREKNAFRCSCHSPWYTVEGVIQLGATEMIFTRGNAWGIFDWNRGIRPREDLRYQASACGISAGREISFNVGYGSSDAQMGTENAFFTDGRIHKLNQVTFHISPANWLLPWHFTSNDNRLEMTFYPNQERVERHWVLFHSLRRRQVFGYFSGKILLDDGTPLEFQNITGFAERRKTSF
ncbi:MAG: DUF2804 domain-containing protein [Treponema sp.]|nr:DUF2804 domain-containing protein [Treponema sp.]